MPAERPRASRYEIDVEVERRRRIGLPGAVLDAAGLAPGDRLHVQVRRDRRIVLTAVTDLLASYAGAIPGIATAGAPQVTPREAQP